MPNSFRRLRKKHESAIKKINPYAARIRKFVNPKSKVETLYLNESRTLYCINGFPANADTFYGHRVLKSLLFYSPIILEINMLIRLELSSSLFHLFLTLIDKFAPVVGLTL